MLNLVKWEFFQILYIGKAKNLAKRVINYTSLNNLTRRLQRMVSLTKKMNFFVTNTEIEALLLECNLIKRHKPRFNIILRDDKSFPYILINKEHKFPRLQKYRGAKNIKGDWEPTKTFYVEGELLKIFDLNPNPR